ncbi:hypothetical protein [Deinococcus sp. QL22]|uniref:hypothetical protein n=1 Tax=Deinococcus sp. QL22 TaxID=2939437 RepID=UPI002017D13E|nr:hypothetical protein [Deinococcus sp. QL22]UQN06068.1 hypothetical protein M1R55_14565 [Deinococcus sp. QL22]
MALVMVKFITNGEEFLLWILLIALTGFGAAANVLLSELSKRSKLLVSNWAARVMIGVAVLMIISKLYFSVFNHISLDVNSVWPFINLAVGIYSFHATNTLLAEHERTTTNSQA